MCQQKFEQLLSRETQQIGNPREDDQQPEVRVALADPEELDDEDKEMLAEGRV